MKTVHFVNLFSACTNTMRGGCDRSTVHVFEHHINSIPSLIISMAELTSTSERPNTPVSPTVNTTVNTNPTTTKEQSAAPSVCFTFPCTRTLQRSGKKNALCDTERVMLLREVACAKAHIAPIGPRN